MGHSCSVHLVILPLISDFASRNLVLYFGHFVCLISMFSTSAHASAACCSAFKTSRAACMRACSHGMRVAASIAAVDATSASVNAAFEIVSELFTVLISVVVFCLSCCIVIVITVGSGLRSSAAISEIAFDALMKREMMLFIGT